MGFSVQNNRLLDHPFNSVCQTRLGDLNSIWMALVEPSQFLTVWSIFRFYPFKMYKWACKKVSFNHLSGRNEQNYQSSPVLTYSKRALFVRHAITCHTPWKTREWNFDGCYILTRAIPMQFSTNWAIKSSKSWSFCEFVILFSCRFATRLCRSILSTPRRKNLWRPGW